MRTDAKNLLARLGASDLPYWEFPDRFAELGYWPLWADPEVPARSDGTGEPGTTGGGDARALQQQLTALARSGDL